MNNKFKVISGDNQPLPKHMDGTPCHRGLSKVPEHYFPCCSMMEQSISTCWADGVRIEFLPKRKIWGIQLRDQSFMTIQFCPWCGHKLEKV